MMFDKSELALVLNDWNYWENPPPLTIPRKILQNPFPINPDLALVVQGVRRCGKSTLLAQIMTALKLNPQDCIFVNFEDPRLSQNLDFSFLDQLVAFGKERRPHAQSRVYFFDEIQNVAGWQKWLHAKMERPGRECFVITGSNASLLSGELASALTGRHTTVELFPFDYGEFKTAKPGAGFGDYVVCGGFPRALTYPEPKTLLREYFTDIIERDVRRHVAARSTLVLTQLVKAVFESMGSEVSQRSLAKMLGVTADTAGAYLDACEAAYILLACPYFTFSERQRSARNRKYYPVDLALREAVITKAGLDQGKNLEAAVFLHLRRKHRHVFYWRQKGEVDFVTMDENGITPYQVSWDGPKQRHEDALAEFSLAFPKANKAVFVSRENIESFLESAKI